MGVRPYAMPTAHCGHLDDGGKVDPSRVGKHAPHVWFDIGSVDDRWCDGHCDHTTHYNEALGCPYDDEPCPCGYQDECAIWCGNGHITGQCPEHRKEITIDSLEAAQLWINVLHRRSIHDLETINDLRHRLTILELPWWRRFRHRI